MRRSTFPLVRGLLAGLLLCLVPPLAGAGSVSVPGAIGSLEVSVESMKALRFRSVVAQEYDFSCGSAAVATLLTYHYGRPTVETDTFDGMFRVGDQDRIRTKGFSMLDMKNYLAREQGMSSDGFRIGLAELEELGVPAIAMIETRGYRHFVVIKGVEDDRVLVGDPALGVKAYTRHGFEEVWVNDILFLIRDDAATARASFNNAETWQVVTRSPVERGVQRDGLAGFTLNLPRASEW